MAEFWRSRSFKVLSKVWDEKLEKSGFQDVEVEVRGDRALKQRSTNCYRQATQLERETRQRYYIIMGHLAHNTIFENALEQMIMIRHSEGASTQEILKQVNGMIKKRHTITHIIRRWQHRWGIRKWSLAERNLRLKIKLRRTG